MKHLTRSPFVWISATIVSASLYFFAFHYFPQAFPIVNLDITMDLDQATEQADIIAKQYGIGPVDYQTAATFHTDTMTKMFVELEAGGNNALVAMMDNNLYMPYTWQIRHFKEHEKHESRIIFRPDGTLYGFLESISENVPGAHITEKEAQTIAEQHASERWNIDFTHYKLVEASQKTEISGRIDHTFVYERTDHRIGEGVYRLNLVVSGDTLTQLVRFVKVPESFMRRYAEMRSANMTISVVATCIFILYLIFGCGFGLYWLFRRRLIMVRQPIIWAIALSLASTLASVNQFPTLWMNYNSAHSINGFLIQMLLSFLVMFLGQIAFLTLIISAAEGLTRAAFGNHPQLWSLWSTENGASYATLGRTIGGYLLVGFNCAFVIGFYLFSLNYLGWWSPSEMLFDPNILATYLPWLSPLALSLNAGFMEECLFRAIPLAGAALLGSHFGKRNWWIGGAFIVQAVVFGAAHANYPVQPAYARLVELLIPSFVWAATYLKFGLLPTIIAHFTYDVIWFSLPLFVARTADTTTYKIIIIAATLIPLLIVAYTYFRKGFWSELSPSCRNDAWSPQAEKEKEELPVEMPIAQPAKQYHTSIIILGILGLIAWATTTRFAHDGITITINRDEAVTAANNFLEEHGTVLTAPWRTLPLVFTNYGLDAQIALQHQFIWKKGKKDLYHTFLGNYLHPAHWTIRYAQFDTDLIARTEEHKVMLYNNVVWRYYHQLPESSAGASLTQQEARAVAHARLQQEFNLDPAQLIELSATQKQQPHRIDWLFVFANQAAYPLQTGRAQISIAIAGDTVIDTARTIHVPEEWQRKEQNKQHMLGIIKFIFGLICAFFVLLGIIVALRQRKIFVLNIKIFLQLCGIMAIFSIITSINSWPNFIGVYNTSLPFNNQLFQTILSFIFGTFLQASAIAYSIALTLSYRTTEDHTIDRAQKIITGVCSGLFITGILSIAYQLLPVNMPIWPDYSPLSYTIPLLGSVMQTVNSYMLLTIVYCIFFMFINNIAIAPSRKNQLLCTILAVLYGMMLVHVASMKMIPLWIVAGTVVGLLFLGLYTHAIRYNYSSIPIMAASCTILGIIQQGIFNAYPGAMLIAIVNVLVVGAVAVWWHMHIRYAHNQ